MARRREVSCNGSLAVVFPKGFLRLLLTRGDLAYCLSAHGCLAVGSGELGPNVNLGAGGLASHMFLFILSATGPINYF